MQVPESVEAATVPKVVGNEKPLDGLDKPVELISANLNSVFGACGALLSQAIHFNISHSFTTRQPGHLNNIKNHIKNRI